MLESLGLSSIEWQIIGVAVGAALASFLATRRGFRTKSAAVESGNVVATLSPEIVEVLHDINKRDQRLEKKVDDQLGLLNRIYTDTQVMRERK